MARILLVDDDPQLLKMASALLVHAQHEVTCCENVIDALELARRENFHVVVTDVNMTPHSGFDLIRSIKLLPNYTLTPIAMLTGRREKRDVEKAVAVGAQDYIVKPLDPEGFIKKVGDLVRLSESHRRAARYAEVQVNEVATCEMAIVVVSLTEGGVLLDSDHQLHIGSVLVLESESFKSIGVPRPHVRVTSCSPGDAEGTFTVRTSFNGLDEKSLVKIRHFVQSRANQDKRARKVS